MLRSFVTRSLTQGRSIPKRADYVFTQSEWDQRQAYFALSDKRSFIPPTRGNNVTSFLERIGRDCDKYSDKFTSWDQLFLMTSDDMEKAGIPTKARKWILNQREAFKQQREIRPHNIPQRRHKYKKVLKFMQLKKEMTEGL